MWSVGFLNFQYPWWFVVFCVICGAVYTLALYLRDDTFGDQKRRIRILMSSLRFLSVTMLALLLLSPFLKYLSETLQKPVVIIAHDNSTSIGDAMTGEDSVTYVDAVASLSRDLSDIASVDGLLFGDRVTEGTSPDFSESMTDISEVLEQIADQYGDQNLASVVIASDGLYNRGANPVYLPRKVEAPIHFIALGDTTVKADLVVQKVLHNRIAFLGDRFPVQIDISANKLAGRNATLVVERLNAGRPELVSSTAINIDRPRYFSTREVILEASEPGIIQYRVRLTGISNEIQYANNVKDIYIEVIDGRIEVLLLAHAPHPDISALRELIVSNENYEVTSALVGEFTGNISDFDLIVMHQLPSVSGTGSRILQEVNGSDIPVLYILGSATNLPAFNLTQDMLSISGSAQSPNEVTAIVNYGFQLFAVPEDIERQLTRFPPLYAPFGEYSVSGAAAVLGYQRIGNVETDFPLILFGDDEGRRTGIIAAEGIWKWRLYDFLQYGSHELTSGLVNKAVQFLTVKDDRRKFRITPSKNLYSDNESISISAELYNDSYELVNTPDALLTIRDGEGNEYNYTFNRQSSSYTIDIGKYAVGSYTMAASATFNGMRYEASGRFSVREVQLEQYRTQADHQLLYLLADRYGGTVYYPDNISAVTTELRSNDSLRPIIYQSAESQPLLNMKWLFFAVLLLLGTEWFLRRYFGGY